MRFYGSAEEESAAIVRATRSAGCAVRTLLPSGDGASHTRGRVDCPDGWHAAALLLALAREDAKTAGARRIAIELRAAAPTDRAYRAAVHRFVKERVRFAPEEGEIFQNGGATLILAVGDCDDHARLVIALYLAGGLSAELGLLHRGDGGGPTHATGIGCVEEECAWAETTVDAEIGEHPLEAAARLGVLDARGDISKEVVIMGSNLPRPPARYLDANPSALVTKDVEALKALGFLASCAEVKDAADPVFREAILAVQMASAPGIVRDGMTGPQTRGVIAALLEERGMGELAQGYIGALAAAPKPVMHTRDLSDGFLRRVISMNDRFVARGAKTRPEHWLAVWNGESGVRASAKNAAGYGGLHGLNSKYLANLGFAGGLSEWVATSAEDQMPVVERYYESIVGFLAPPGGAPEFSLLDSPEAIYAWNFLPAYVRRLEHERPVFARADDDPHRFYKDNRVLDRDGDGVIDLDDLRTWVAHRQREEGARWIELRRRLYEQPGGEPGPGVAAVVAAGGTVATIAALVIAAVADRLG